MERLNFLTAGESHGPQLTGIIEGLPAGLTVSSEFINAQLRRRQKGHGRGGRMKIETDAVRIAGGVRGNVTLGSPVALVVENADHKNWQGIMNPEGPLNGEKIVDRPRPGHADLAGAVKYDTTDMRNILERSSARETTMRVALGAVCRAFLAEFGVEIFSHVLSIGNVALDPKTLDGVAFAAIKSRAEESPVRCADPAAEKAMMKAIDTAGEKGDTLGGVVEIVVSGLPMGLGTHVHWERKLDGRLAQALMSVNAVKGVGVGIGFSAAVLPGSQVHDGIVYQDGAFRHTSNRQGGLTGGMTDGELLTLTAAMKPIATLGKPLPSINIKDKSISEAAYERSDVCAVPACGVVCEAMAALVLADAWLEKFGGDTIAEIKRNVAAYREHIRNF